VPRGWFTADLDVRIDREEILVVGELADPVPRNRGDDGRLARVALIDDFRERSRDRRMAIAADAEVIPEIADNAAADVPPEMVVARFEQTSHRFLDVRFDQTETEHAVRLYDSELRRQHRIAHQRQHA
jgi:hypothetical protein